MSASPITQHLQRLRILKWCVETGKCGRVYTPERQSQRQRDLLGDIESKNLPKHYAFFLQNGGYIQPPPIKRQFRDPHADWWDKQERRNYGEPVHEDNDLLGMFTPHVYTWVSPGKGLVQIGIFIATFMSVCYFVKLTYPDVPAYPREFEGGLVRELGGSGAMPVGLRLPH